MYLLLKFIDMHFKTASFFVVVVLNSNTDPKILQFKKIQIQVFKMKKFGTSNSVF